MKHICERPSAVNTIRADLTGDSFCSVGDIIARGSTPILALCRELLAAGMDPDQALEVYRGATLALTVRSIGEAAGLEVNGKGTGFKPITAVGAASPMRSRGAAATRHEARP